MTATESAIDVDLEIDLDKPIICEVRWLDVKTNKIRLCGEVAGYVAMCHDEIVTHDYYQILFCSKCYFMATLKLTCVDDGQKLVLKARKL